MGLTMSLNIEILNKTLIPMGKKGIIPFVKLVYI